MVQFVEMEQQVIHKEEELVLGIMELDVNFIKDSIKCQNKNAKLKQKKDLGLNKKPATNTCYKRFGHLA